MIKKFKPKKTKPKPKNLVDHLEEVRKRLFIIIGALVLATIIVFPFAHQILLFLLAPLGEQQLIYTSPPEAFLANIKLAFTGGILLASPIIIYQVMAFVGPALYKKERRLFYPFIAGMYLLFLLGVTFAYTTVIPFTLNFFLRFAGEDLAPLFTISSYVSFNTNLLLVFGLTFQTPLAFLLLGLLNVITADLLQRIRKFAFLAIIILAAVITPPDGISQIMVALPLILLYEVGILLVRLVHRKRVREKEN